MAIFLRQSHLVKPPRWGSFADVQYAIRVNSEKIYGCNPDNDVLVMPLFWGLPPLDYSGYNNNGTNYGATYKDGSLDFGGADDYVYKAGNPIAGAMTICVRAKTSNVLEGIVHYNEANPPVASTFDRQLYIDSNGYATFRVYNGGAQLTTGITNIADGDYHYIVGTINTVLGNSIWVDGTLENTNSGGTDGYNGYSSAFFYVGVSCIVASVSYFDGFIDEVRISNVARTADQIALFHDRPWDLYRPVSRPVWSIPTGAYTITATEGSYSITGQTVNLLRDSIVSSEAGSIALSGLSTNLLKGFVLGAGAGSITLTGFSTDLLKGSLIGAEAGSIVLTGQDVTLVYSGGAYMLTADSGSIALTGTQVDLLRAGRLPSGAGSIILTGINVDLLRGFLLGAEAGSYTLIGTATTLLRAAKLGIDSGVYDLVGFNVGLNYSEEEWKKIILRGLDVLSGQLVNITGQYKEV